MLSLLLDEQISSRVATGLSALRADIPVISLYEWRGGMMSGTDDALLLQEAAKDALTLVTYDLKTIPPLLVEWSTSGHAHGGVIFVDNRSIAPADFGSLARALLACFETHGEWEWTDRIIYLKSA